MVGLPTKLIDWRHELEARRPERNIARAYKIGASADLFEH